MSALIDRNQALELLCKYLKSERLRNHCLATEAIMKKVALHLGEDEKRWGLLGLLHDLDLDIVNNDMNRHTLETARILSEAGFDEEFVEIIKSHNEAVGRQRTLKVEHALSASENISGLIVAAALVLPSKKLSDLKPENIMRRFKEKHFARGADRNAIMECEKVGISFEQFCALALEAMQEISDVLGL